MSLFNAPFLARLLLKNHQELLQQAASARFLSPVQLRLLSGPLDCNLNVTNAVQGYALEIVDNTKNCSYTLNVSSERGRVPAISVSMKDAKGTIRQYQFGFPQKEGEKLSNAELFSKVSESLKDLDVPAAFKELHEAMLSELKRVCGVTSSVEAKDVEVEKATVSEATNDSANAIAVIPEFSAIRLPRTGKPDLAFQGKLLGRVQTPLRFGRYRELSIYQTLKGKLVVANAGLSLHLTETPRIEVEVFDTPQQVIEHLGYGALARALFSQVGWDADLVETLE